MKKAFIRCFSVLLLVIILATGALPIQQAGASTIDPLATITIKRVTTPSNLTAKLSSNMGVTLNWTDNSSNEGGFLLQRQSFVGSMCYGWYDIAELPANTITYKDVITLESWMSGRNCNEYRIKALGSGLILDSVYTDETRIYLKTPEAPQITLQFAADASVLVKWSGCTEALVDYYIIKRKAPGAASYTDIATIASNTTTYTDASQKQAGTYQYTVHAIGYFSDYLPSSVGITIPSSAPNAPSSLVLTPTSPNSVKLTWVDNSINETGFRIDWTINGVAQNSIYVEPNGQLYNINSIPTGSITIKVKAVNAFGFSAFSNTVTASVPTNQPGSLDTSTASPWAVSEIEDAAEYGLLTEKLHDNFNLNITREEFCEIAVKLYEKLSHTQAVLDGNNPFTDTTNSEIIKAYKLDIVNGTSPTEFSPNNPITRQEICVMIVNTLKAAFPALNTTVANPHTYADNSAIASWAINEVRYANLKEIMTGVGDNMFDPLNVTKRDQGVSIIKRAYVKYTV